MLSPRGAAACTASQPISRGGPSCQAKAQVLDHLCDLCVCIAPTNDYPEEQKDTFFVEVQHAIDRVAARNTLVLAGDFNAKVGVADPQQWHGCLGDFALKKKSMRTSGMALWLLDFCVANALGAQEYILRSQKHTPCHLDWPRRQECRSD